MKTSATLKNDERAARAVAGAENGAVAGGFKEFDGVDAGEGDGGKSSEDEAGEEGNGDGEEEDWEVLEAASLRRGMSPGLRRRRRAGGRRRP